MDLVYYFIVIIYYSFVLLIIEKICNSFLYFSILLGLFRPDGVLFMQIGYYIFILHLFRRNNTKKIFLSIHIYCNNYRYCLLFGYQYFGNILPLPL